MLKIFIGFDARETVLYHVLSQSLLAHTSQPLAITPLVLSHLRDIFTREQHPLQSTDFAFSRFLVPYLSGYEGWSLFLDNDIVAQADIAELFALADSRYAVQVVKHQHRPSEERKFRQTVQTQYEKKNWSSVMLFNNAKCRALTPELVNTATGLLLHQFKWLSDDSLIGALPPSWNHLVDYDAPDPSAKLIHFTSGGPYFSQTAACEHADTWWQARAKMLSLGE